MNMKILPFMPPLAFSLVGPGHWHVHQSGNLVAEMRYDGRRYWHRRVGQTAYEEDLIFSYSSAVRNLNTTLKESTTTMLPLVQFRTLRGTGELTERVRLVVVNAMPPDEEPGHPRLIVLKRHDGSVMSESIPHPTKGLFSEAQFSKRLRPLARAMADEFFPDGWQEYIGRLQRGRHTNV